MEDKMCSIPVPPDFSFRRCLWFLDRSLDDATHRVMPGSVRKLVRIADQDVLLEISGDDNGLKAEVLTGETADLSAVRSFVRSWFDLGHDLVPFYALLEKDPDLAPLLQFKGLRLLGIPDFFEAICWGIIGQQINLAFAYKLKRRMVELFGEYVIFEGEKYFRFPDPGIVQQIDPEVLRSLQFSGRKAEYLIGIARLFASGELSAAKLAALEDEGQMRSALMSVRGIGEWTAQYALLKGMYAMDAVPYGDVGINTALWQLKGIPKQNNREEVEKVFEGFPGWRSYLVLYLWQSLRAG